jgi:hypothetical protein
MHRVLTKRPTAEVINDRVLKGFRLIAVSIGQKLIKRPVFSQSLRNHTLDRTASLRKK